MFKKILVGVDGSDVSLHAARRAISIAKISNSELHIIYVVEGIPLAGNIEKSIKSQVKQRLEKDGKVFLDNISEMAKNEGCSITQHIVEGSPGSTIVDTAEELGCDLIVVGSLGHSAISRVLLGSVSSYVVNYAKINVLVDRG